MPETGLPALLLLTFWISVPTHLGPFSNWEGSTSRNLPFSCRAVLGPFIQLQPVFEASGPNGARMGRPQEPTPPYKIIVFPAGAQLILNWAAASGPSWALNSRVGIIFSL